MIDKETVVKNYIRGLEKGSYEDVIVLFAPHALVHSPLYGEIEAAGFYKELFSDTTSSKITLKSTYISTDNPRGAAAHFIYSWTMKDGSLAEFECVDVFEFDSNGKIEKLTIIYDTKDTRLYFEKMHE